MYALMVYDMCLFSAMTPVKWSLKQRIWLVIHIQHIVFICLMLVHYICHFWCD